MTTTLLEEKITWVHHWSDRTFSFRTTRSQSFRFVAGEFATIKLENTIPRAYSIVSPPWADYLEFYSIKIPDGAFTSKLQNIKEGDSLFIRPKVTGTLRNDMLTSASKLVLLATGTGIAPFMSIIRDLEVLEKWDKIELWHNVRHREDLAYYQDLSSSFSDSELSEIIGGKLHYFPLVTSEGAKRITALLESDNMVHPRQDRVMICGNLTFNKECIAILKNKGMIEGNFRGPGDFVTEQAFVE